MVAEQLTPFGVAGAGQDAAELSDLPPLGLIRPLDGFCKPDPRQGQHPEHYFSAASRRILSTAVKNSNWHRERMVTERRYAWRRCDGDAYNSGLVVGEARRLGIVVDISALAAQAVALVANHLWAVAAGVMDRAQASAVGRLYELMREQLQRTELGAAVLGGLEEQPQEPGRRSMAASALAEAALADAEFTARLQKVVHEVSISRGIADHAAISRQANISAVGYLTISRGNVATSRRHHIGTVLIAAGVLLVGGTTTAIIIGTRGSERAPTSMGRDPGAAGVRETTEGYLDALAARDTTRYCAYLSTAELAYASQFGGCEQAAQDFVFTRQASDQIGAARIDQILIDEAEACADVSYDAGEMFLYLRREADRWVIAEKVFPRSASNPPSATDVGGNPDETTRHMTMCRK